MRVLLLGFAKIAYMPYMHFYLDACKTVDYDLVFWDRDGEPDVDVPQSIRHAFKFDEYIDEDLPFKNKLKLFYHYRKFVINVLKHNKYDKIVLLHTTQGLTIIDYLFLHYRKRYLLDFRDISHEDKGIYRKIVAFLAHNAKLVVVSSNAFKKFLPTDMDIFTVHNYLNDSLKHRDCHSNNEKRDVVRISFWGLVRQKEINEKLIHALGNDKRFELHYYGRMQTEGDYLQQLVKQNSYTNVWFHGQYRPEQRYDFASTTDLIHNFYNTGAITGNAMGNKYYDGIIFRIPQLCTQGSYMADVVTKQSVGLSVDLDKNDFPDLIYSYYCNLQVADFNDKCDNALFNVIQEQKETVKAVVNFLQS